MARNGDALRVAKSDATALETALIALLRASRGAGDLPAAQAAADEALRRHAGYTDEGVDLCDALRAINGS